VVSASERDARNRAVKISAHRIVCATTQILRSAVI
jgi:hypothetical protein